VNGRLKKTTLLLCAALVLLPWIASAQSAPGAEPATATNRTSPAQCSLAGDLFGATAPIESAICNISVCVTVSDCYEACPEATSASCVNNACQYGSGGGGGGGGGPICNASLCISASDCYDACPEASFAYCGSDNICVYQ